MTSTFYNQEETALNHRPSAFRFALRPAYGSPLHPPHLPPFPSLPHSTDVLQAIKEPSIFCPHLTDNRRRGRALLR